MIELQINQLANNAYCSEWYNLKANEKKIFLILLMQLQQMKIKNNAYGLVELNLNAYGEVRIFF